MDWNDAYANAPYIKDAGNYRLQWAEQAAAFRLAQGSHYHFMSYGDHQREVLDLFMPSHEPKGLAVFVHGGYWLDFNSSSWSHLAAGALMQGWAVAMPTYTLAPEAHIKDITQQIGRAINFAASKVIGPLCLAGHSAGGHLVTRMMCEDSPLSREMQTRLRKVTSVSGLHDLRPLLKTSMNDQWQMDKAEAWQESPVLKAPLDDVQLTCWVGAEERPEFIRQNDLLANIWTSFDLPLQNYHAPNHHHFSVINDLTDPQSALVEAFIGKVI